MGNEWLLARVSARQRRMKWVRQCIDGLSVYLGVACAAGVERGGGGGGGEYLPLVPEVSVWNSGLCQCKRDQKGKS